MSDKKIQCPGCGASVDAGESKCPHCGALLYEGAEKEYFEEMEDIRKNLEETSDDCEETFEAAVGSGLKTVFITIGVVICLAVILVLLVNGLI